MVFSIFRLLVSGAYHHHRTAHARHSRAVEGAGASSASYGYHHEIPPEEDLRVIAQRAVLGILILMATSCPVCCQDEPGLDDPPIRMQESDRSDWDDLRFTTREIGFRFTHPRMRDAFVLLGLTVGAIALERNKQELLRQEQEGRTPALDRFAGTVRPLGEAILPAAALSTYLVGRFSGSASTRRTGLILMESMAFTVVATESLQYVLAEQRPLDGGELRWFQPGGHGVSGHTSIVASCAVPLDRLFFRFEPSDGGFERFGKIVGKAVVYGAPVATGWSRLNDNKHYAWNVLLGLGVGYTIGGFVADAHDPARERRASGSRDWSITPILGDRDQVGLAVTWRLP